MKHLTYCTNHNQSTWPKSISACKTLSCKVQLQRSVLWFYGMQHDLFTKLSGGNYFTGANPEPKFWNTLITTLHSVVIFWIFFEVYVEIKPGYNNIIHSFI